MKVLGTSLAYIALLMQFSEISDVNNERQKNVTYQNISLNSVTENLYLRWRCLNLDVYNKVNCSALNKCKKWEKNKNKK